MIATPRRPARLARVALVALLLAPAALAGETEVVFDVSPFVPSGVGGELIGVSSPVGHVVHARIDATLVSNDSSDWTLFANFSLPTGLAGVDSQTQGWTGTGEFSTTVHTDAFNGQLGNPGGGLFSWYVHYAGGHSFTLPGGGIGFAPMDGVFTTLKLTLTVCDCPAGTWADVGHALAGASGTPQLAGTGNLCPSAAGSLVLSQAPPGAPGVLVVGLSGLWAPFHGGLLLPSPDLLIPLPADAGGGAVVPFTFPIGVPPGLQFWLQHWTPDATAIAGYAASNGLLATVPDDC